MQLRVFNNGTHQVGLPCHSVTAVDKIEHRCVIMKLDSYPVYLSLKKWKCPKWPFHIIILSICFESFERLRKASPRVVSDALIQSPSLKTFWPCTPSFAEESPLDSLLDCSLSCAAGQSQWDRGTVKASDSVHRPFIDTPISRQIGLLEAFLQEEIF